MPPIRHGIVIRSNDGFREELSPSYDFARCGNFNTTGKSLSDNQKPWRLSSPIGKNILVAQMGKSLP
jgi:hypothetical protein